MDRPLDVSVKHRGGRVQTELMSCSMDLDPSIRVRLVLTDLTSNILMEDLRPSPRKAPQSSLFQFEQDFAHGKLGDAGEPIDFDRRECLQMDFRIRVVNDFEECAWTSRTASCDAIRRRCASRSAPCFMRAMSPLEDFVILPIK